MTPVSLSLRGPSLAMGAARPSTAARSSAPPPRPAPQQRARAHSALASAAKRLGISAGQMATINGRIREAVNGLDLSAAADPKAAIDATVDATLRDSGVDPKSFRSEVRSALEASGARPAAPGPGAADADSARWANLQQALATLDAATAAEHAGGAEGESDGDGDDGGALLGAILRPSTPGSFVDVTA